jgi:hypothetical protein
METAKTRHEISTWQEICNISYALGGYSDHKENDRIADGKIDEWRPDRKAVKATIEFAKATGKSQYQM